MKIINYPIATLAIALTIVPIQAKISFDPPPIEDWFTQAEVVCRGTVLSVRKEPEGWPTFNGELIPVEYIVIIDMQQQYKGAPAASRITIDFPNFSQTDGLPLQPGSQVILFLKARNDHAFELSDPRYSIRLGARRPAETLADNALRQIQSDILASADSQGELTGALLSLSGFRELDVRTKEAVEKIESQDQDIEMLRLLLLVRADPDKYFAEMVITLKRWCTANPSVHVGSHAGGTIVIAFGQMLSHPKSSSQLASLKTLATVDTPFIRQSSMSGIRSLHSPDSIPFLIKQLDFPDDTYTQYLALISLVEITGKGGSEFGPAMNFFERDPQRYIATWKRWWSEQPSGQNGTDPKVSPLPIF